MSSAIFTSSMNNIRPAPSESKAINLDLGEQRRHSFLPDSWNETKRDTNVKNMGGDTPEDDELFMYMQSEQLFKERPLQKFSTGGKYLGQWNRLGIAGKGVYKYPHGVIYDGYFNRDGQFHGTGILVYPNGQRIEGIWKNGKLGRDCNYIAKGGIVMNKNYCLMPDRRFQIEFEQDFNPVGQEYLTDEPKPPREIPDGCYDMVSGFYDPAIKSVCEKPKEELHRKSKGEVGPSSSTKFLFSGDEERRDAFNKVLKTTESEQSFYSLMKVDGLKSSKIISWIPSTAQEEWIIKNCRKSWEEPVGYRPDLYEDWTKGGKAAFDKFKDMDVQQDSMCKLKSLNLDTEVVASTSSKRFLSFVKNNKTNQDTVTVEMLTKMFAKKTESSTLNIKMQSSTTQECASSELVLSRHSPRSHSS